MSWLTRSAKRLVRVLGWEVERRPDFMMIRRIIKNASRPGAENWQGRTGLKLNLGSGLAPLPGYVNVDVQSLPEVEVVAPVTDLAAFPDGCAAEVRMDAVFEHLYHFERPRALAEWYRVLQPGGELRLNWIPDFELVIELYQARPPGLTGEWFDLKHARNLISGLYTEIDVPEMLHKDLFTKESVRAELERAGYVAVEVENPVYREESYPVAICARAVKPEGRS